MSSKIFHGSCPKYYFLVVFCCFYSQMAPAQAETYKMYFFKWVKTSPIVGIKKPYLNLCLRTGGWPRIVLSPGCWKLLKEWMLHCGLAGERGRKDGGRETGHRDDSLYLPNSTQTLHTELSLCSGGVCTSPLWKNFHSWHGVTIQLSLYHLISCMVIPIGK